MLLPQSVGNKDSTGWKPTLIQERWYRGNIWSKESQIAKLAAEQGSDERV